MGNRTYYCRLRSHLDVQSNPIFQTSQTLDRTALVGRQGGSGYLLRPARFIQQQARTVSPRPPSYIEPQHQQRSTTSISQSSIFSTNSSQQGLKGSTVVLPVYHNTVVYLGEPAQMLRKWFLPRIHNIVGLIRAWQPHPCANLISPRSYYTTSTAQTCIELCTICMVPKFPQ